MSVKSHPMTRFLIIIFTASLALVGHVRSQDLQTQLGQASQAYKNMDYQGARDLLERITKTYGGRAPMLYGPKFGVIYYRKGLCELKLASEAKRGNRLGDAEKWFAEAASSFEVCYTKYPNGAPNMAATTNTAHKSCLQRWAESKMGTKEYEEALKLYKKFELERDSARDPKLPTLGGFNINLAICNFLQPKPDISEGINKFEQAIANKEKWKTSDSGIVAAFLALSQAVIGQKQEGAMVDFLMKNKADLTLEPYQMYEFCPLFLKLAANALEADMYVAARNLYSMIPSSEVMMQDMQVRINQLPGRRGIKDGNNIIEVERLKKGLASLKERVLSGDPADVGVLTAMCFLHDKAGNQRGVYAGLQLLERYYNKSSKRETNLYNLVRVSALLDQIMDTEKYGTLFLNDFPESDKAESVRRLMLSSLFFSGEYAKCIQIAEPMIDTLPENTEQHDICLFVLGGSYFYLGRFDDAQPMIDQHIETYPESKLIMHSEYYQASCQTRLQNWEKAAELLDKFLEKYPEPETNIYTAIALYDRANCHFSNSEYEPAMVLLDRLEEEFPKSSAIDMAYNMKGNIFESTADFEDAEKYYKLALEVAEQRKNDSVAGEALSYLVGMLASQQGPDKDNPNPRLKDVEPYYDLFMEKYSSTFFKPQVVVFGMPAMKEVGREQEGLDNLQTVISDLAGKEKQFFLEECINAFSEFFLQKEGNTPDQLKDLYYDFPDIDFSNKRVLALLRIAVIGIFEEQIKTAEANEDKDLVLKYNSGIKALFKDLKSEFNPKDLTNLVLVRIGDYLRKKTSTPKQALEYYEELLTRDDKTGEYDARLGIADVLGQSDSVADNKQAIVSLEDVMSRAKDDLQLQEEALFRIVEITAKIDDWDKCEKSCRQYLDAKFTKKTAQVSYLFAVSFDKRNMVEDALFYYGMVYNRYRGFILISAPSVQRVMELMWDRNLKAGQQVGVGDKQITLEMDDRQACYQLIGWPYVNGTRRIREENPDMSDEEKDLWDAVQALVTKYETSGQIKTMEQVKAEELEAKRRGEGK
ncbi:MAG: tetratricopeptide repeat protein [Akkermansiaceae bacterium]